MTPRLTYQVIIIINIQRFKIWHIQIGNRAILKKLK